MTKYAVLFCLTLNACGGSTTSTSGGGEGYPKLETARLLLQEKDPTGYTFFTRHIREITVTPQRPVGVQDGVINFTPAYIRASSAEWLASVYVHEAVHVAYGIGCSIDEEKLAIEDQLSVLILVGGTQHEIAYLQSQRGVHSCESFIG